MRCDVTKRGGKVDELCEWISEAEWVRSEKW